MGKKYETFGEFIEAKRKANGFTLRGMADELEISAPYLTDIEKGRRNPPEMPKLEEMAALLHLSDDEKIVMFDLAGKKRNTVAPDIPDYIMNKSYVSVALRTARELDASEEEWKQFVEDLRNKRKG